MTGNYTWPYATPAVMARVPEVTREMWRGAWLAITGDAAALLRRDAAAGIERWLVPLGEDLRQVEYRPGQAIITGVFPPGGARPKFKRARARDRKERDE